MLKPGAPFKEKDVFSFGGREFDTPLGCPSSNSVYIALEFCEEGAGALPDVRIAMSSAYREACMPGGGSRKSDRNIENRVGEMALP